MPQPPPRQRRPGVGRADAVVHHPGAVRLSDQAPVKSREPVRLRVLPDPPFGLDAREIPQPLLGHLLRPRPEAVADVVAWDDEVPAILPAASHQHMGVRLVGVVMAGRDPFQTGLPQVGGDPRHHLADVGF